MNPTTKTENDKHKPIHSPNQGANPNPNNHHHKYYAKLWGAFLARHYSVWSRDGLVHNSSPINSYGTMLLSLIVTSNCLNLRPVKFTRAYWEIKAGWVVLLFSISIKNASLIIPIAIILTIINLPTQPKPLWLFLSFTAQPQTNHL